MAGQHRQPHQQGGGEVGDVNNEGFDGAKQVEKCGSNVEIYRADIGLMAAVALVGQAKAISEVSRRLP